LTSSSDFINDKELKKMTIDQQIAAVAAEWEKSKNQSQSLLLVLGKLCELNKAVITLLRKQGVPYSEAAAMMETDIARYRALLTQSSDELLEVEGEYKKLLDAKQRGA
jgi:DNA-directed RNA polymerase specialized sigma24 family protein